MSYQDPNRINHQLEVIGGWAIRRR